MNANHRPLNQLTLNPVQIPREMNTYPTPCPALRPHRIHPSASTHRVCFLSLLCTHLTS